MGKFERVALSPPIPRIHAFLTAMRNLAPFQTAHNSSFDVPKAKEF
jgi:hypothetical protein